MSAAPPLLTIENLCFDFDGQSEKTVNALELSVKKGEIVCILGASGCGKTTVLNLIAGLLKPKSGSINLQTESGKRNSIGYIFQSDALFPWRTVEGNLKLAFDINGKLDRSKAKETMQLYLSMFHLNPHVLSKYPTQLSGGMRQRVSIIQSLMFDPELLLLDEPFSALDYYTKLSLEEEFCNLVKEKNKSAILVTHDIEEAVSMGTRAFIMSGGKLAKEFHIRKKSEADITRGSEEFAKHYREIWSELKTIISG
ncbi:MAG TPA: ATP-binding cassette domain-containing protein [Candidatus Melainabacteria bacterium]|nr:ATP-binding cassette domain-containing protein [Candidatus Melainabacteria bacterium]HIN64770.1 ATP-binding cassette domain-containing protein [Candidatus Obscuribacterales bacterium]